MLREMRGMMLIITFSRLIFNPACGQLDREMKYLGLSGVLAFPVKERRALAFSAGTEDMPEMDAESLTLSRTETK